MRSPIHERVENVLRKLERHPHRIAVVVVANVVPPVHEIGVCLPGMLHVPVEHVDHAVASVDFDDRRDERDEMIADVPYIRTLIDGQPIGELHERRRRARFRRVDRARDVIDGSRALGDASRHGVVHADRARIGKLAQIGTILVEPAAP